MVQRGARAIALHLGEVRGGAEAAVEKEGVAMLSCAPFTADLGERSGKVEAATTVTGALGPFCGELAPTTWIFSLQHS